MFTCLPEVPTWIRSQLPTGETCSQAHPSLALFSSSTPFPSPLPGLPRISFQVSSLFLNPCLGVCFWGNLSLNLQILTQRAAHCPHSSIPSFPSFTTYQDGHSMLVCLEFHRRVHAHSTSEELCIWFSKQVQNSVELLHYWCCFLQIPLALSRSLKNKASGRARPGFRFSGLIPAV